MERAHISFDEFDAYKVMNTNTNINMCNVHLYFREYEVSTTLAF